MYSSICFFLNSVLCLGMVYAFRNYFLNFVNKQDLYIYHKVVAVVTGIY